MKSKVSTHQEENSFFLSAMTQANAHTTQCPVAAQLMAQFPDLVLGVMPYAHATPTPNMRDIWRPRQVHGKDVTQVPPMTPTVWTDHTRPSGDAVIARMAGTCVGVVTADCVPLLLWNHTTRCVAAIHAGWRSAVLGIVEETWKRFASEAPADHWFVYIGPCIRQRSFQVREDVRTQVLDVMPTADIFLIPESSETYLFDLVGFIQCQLHALGVPAPHIFDENQDTYTEKTLYSFRRATHQGQALQGHQLNGIGWLV